MIRCYITDRSAWAGTEAERWRRMLACVERACVAGVEYVQLREKDLGTRELERLAGEVVRLANGRARVLVNTRADVALAAGAHGVHLPSGLAAFTASEVRALWMKASSMAPVIGVSCHTLDEVRMADAHAADFAVFGPVFAKGGAAENGLRKLEEACRSVRMPVLALGGVDESNAQMCMHARAAGVAGISMWQRV